MLRFTYVAVVVESLLFAFSSSAWAETPSMGPSQALVRINASGQLEVVSRASKPVYETMQGTRTVRKTEQRQIVTKKKVMKADGGEEWVEVPSTVQVEIEVPETYTYTVSKMVYESIIQKFPASTNSFRRDADKAELPLFDLAGNRLSVTAIEDRLHDWTLVLISNSGKELDRKFANLFKPTTIVIGIPPMAMPAYPAPQPTDGGPLPIPQPAPPGAPEAARENASGLRPVAYFAADTMPQLPNSPEPTFAFAKVWGEKTLALRTESEKTLTMTCMISKEVEKIHDGKAVTVVVCEPKQMEKTIEIRETVRHPLAEVSITRMPNKELTKSELPSVLAVERLAMVSADGKPVDSLWQRNLRDGALVIVAPAAQGYGMPAPMMMPRPGYGPPTAPGTVVPQPVSPQVIPLPAPPAGGPAT